MTLRVGSLFSGYGGLDLGLSTLLDAEPMWFVEYDKHPSTILAHHWPDVPNYGDVTAIDWATVPPVDIITGGYPCQPFSHAGNRKGTQDDRHLWPYVADCLRVLRPRLAVFENVAGHLSLGFDTVLADLAALGFDAEWLVVRASDVGAPHQRQRLFIVATDAHNGRRWQPDAGQRPIPVADPYGSDPDGLTLLPSPVASVSEPAAWKPGVQWWLQSRAARNLEAIVTGNTPLLPTPAVNDMGRGKTADEWDAWRDAMRDKHGNGNGNGKSLEIEAQRLLPTPTARDHKGPNPNQRTGGVDLPMTLLPTPRATDGDKGGPNQTNGRGVRDSLPGVTPLLPTPRATRGGSASETRDLLLGGITAHPQNVRSPEFRRNTSPTPNEVIADGADFGPYTAAITRWEAVLGRPAPSPTEPGRDGRPRLSPAFVEWMMGLPAGHVTGTGIPRNAQLKALGNGVVPQQAAYALSILLPRLWEVAA